MTKKKIPKILRRFTKVPDEYLAFGDLNGKEMILLGYIYGFKGEGCWMSIANLARHFFVPEVTMKRWVGRLKKLGYIYHRHTGNRCWRWAKGHPATMAGIAVWENKRRAGKLYVRDSRKKSSQGVKSEPLRGSKVNPSGGQKRTPIREGIREDITASPTPTPAERSPATLKKVCERLSPNEIQQRKNRQIAEVLSR